MLSVCSSCPSNCKTLSSSIDGFSNSKMSVDHPIEFITSPLSSLLPPIYPGCQQDLHLLSLYWPLWQLCRPDLLRAGSLCWRNLQPTQTEVRRLAEGRKDKQHTPYRRKIRQNTATWIPGLPLRYSRSLRNSGHQGTRVWPPQQWVGQLQ